MSRTLKRSHLVTVATALSIVLVLGSVVLARPAFALGDQASRDDLPLVIDESIPDDATLISSKYALLDTGEVVSVKDGSLVDDPELVGSLDTPADPQALTGATRFERISVGEAREELEESDISLQSLGNGGYGAYWGTSSGTPAFFMGDGTMFVCQAKGVVDVSEHNGTIDWAAAQADGVEGAIIRIGYGDGNTDDQAKRNISECKRLGIPFGVYLFSYAENSEITGADEGAWTVKVLESMGVSPSDLSLPVYYDLEAWEGTWSGHTEPSDPDTYTTIAKQWAEKLQAAGYENIGIYSGSSYLKNQCNSTYIHSLATWVAQYHSEITYTDFPGVFRGWQYSSSGSVDGIGTCDLNAFGNSTYINGQDNWLATSDYDGTALSSLGTKVTDIEEGDYYIKSALGERFVDIDNASTSDGAAALIWSPNDQDNQLFHITPVGAGQYTIRSVSSGKLLDVSNGEYRNGTAVIQWTANGGTNQLWEFYRTSSGELLISSVSAGSHNKVLDLESGDSDLGTSIALWAANAGNNQLFQLYQKAELDEASLYTLTSGAGLSLGVRDDSQASGAIMETQSPSDSLFQRFRLSYEGNGRYQLLNRVSGLPLDLSYGSSASGTSVTQFSSNGGENQLWYFQRQGSGWRLVNCAGNTALTSKETAGSAVVGDTVASGSSAQVWSFVSEDDDRAIVRFDSEGGTSVAMQVVSKGAMATAPQIPQLAGRSFDGWYTDASGGTRFDFSTALSADTTLFAHWAVVTGWVTGSDGVERWYQDGAMFSGGNVEVYDPATSYWYYLDANGGKVTSRVVWLASSGGKWVYYGPDGVMVHGEAYLSYDAEHTGWYHFDEATGAMSHGVTWLASSGGKWVYYDIYTGIMVYGEAYLSYDAEHTGWYHFDEATGAMSHGVTWLSSGSKWVYYDSSSGIMAHGLVRLSYDAEHTGWYCFDMTTGAMAHGTVWVSELGAWRTFDATTGKMA